MSTERARRGFTLIELLIVVVIIGILAAIAIPKFAATKDKAKLGSVKSDLRNIMTAEEAYYIDWGSYTSSLSGTLFQEAPGNKVDLSGSETSFTATVSNESISADPRSCTVTVGGDAENSGEIVCS